MAEFVEEIIAAHPELQARVDAYARLSPDALRIIGADRFPPRLFEVAS